MENVDSADLRTHIDLMINALKTHDNSIINVFKQPFCKLLGSKYVADLLTAAMHQLAVSDVDTFRWAIENYYDPNIYQETRNRVLKLATQRLSEQGFVRGRDFQINSSGEIVLRREIQEKLTKIISTYDRLLLEPSIKVIA